MCGAASMWGRLGRPRADLVVYTEKDVGGRTATYYRHFGTYRWIQAQVSCTAMQLPWITSLYEAGFRTSVALLTMVATPDGFQQTYASTVDDSIAAASNDSTHSIKLFVVRYNESLIHSQVLHPHLQSVITSQQIN